MRRWHRYKKRGSIERLFSIPWLLVTNLLKPPQLLHVKQEATPRNGSRRGQWALKQLQDLAKPLFVWEKANVCSSRQLHTYPTLHRKNDTYIHTCTVHPQRKRTQTTHVHTHTHTARGGTRIYTHTRSLSHLWRLASRTYIHTHTNGLTSTHLLDELHCTHPPSPVKF